MQGALYTDATPGYALALTPTTAFVWPYTTTISSPETFTFDIPHPSKHHGDPLPLGSLVYSSATPTDIGLVIVMPTTGMITFWESASSAALDRSRQSRHSLEGSINGMYSSESVEQIMRAEPVGFILRLNSGRIVHLSLRDSQGRPQISTHVLSKHQTNAGGLFGGIKSVFGAASWRRDIVAVRAGRLSKQLDREFLVISSLGDLQTWVIHRGGHYSLKGESNARDVIVSASQDLMDTRDKTFEVLDVVVVPSERQDFDVVGDGKLKVVALVAFLSRIRTTYVLARLEVGLGVVAVEGIHRIRCYEQSLDGSSTAPRVLLPLPGNIAFIVFSRAIVLASVAGPSHPSEQQLFGEAHSGSLPFQDVVDFRDGVKAEIVGCGTEDSLRSGTPDDDEHSSRAKFKNPGCVVLVKGFGIIRMASLLPAPGNYTAEIGTLSAKSKIEQAIFYGTGPHKLLNFAGRPELQFSTQEVESAAIEISQDILTSSNKAIPVVTPSLDSQMRDRSTAIRNLAIYLQSTGLDLSRTTRWRLLWDAEKLAASRAVWRLYDRTLKYKNSQQQDDDKMEDDRHVADEETLLLAITKYLPKPSKTEARPEVGEVDPVRHWFIRDAGKIEQLLGWAFEALIVKAEQGIHDATATVRFIGEADDIMIGALETAFKFRQENAALYCLPAESMAQGLYVQGEEYEGLPEFWTSQSDLPGIIQQLIEIAQSSINESWQKKPSPEVAEPQLVEKLRADHIRLIDTFFSASTEYYRYREAQNDELVRNVGYKAHQEFIESRHNLILNLLPMGLLEKGLAIAEAYKMTETIAIMLLFCIDVVSERQNKGLTDQDTQPVVLDVNARIDRYFEMFGDEWANALFSQLIEQKKCGPLMSNFTRWQPHLTKFLESHQRYAKLSWINAVLGEKDYYKASTTLLGLGGPEHNLWSQKIETSISKLAVLAAAEGSQSETVDNVLADSSNLYDSKFTTIYVQEMIWENVQPVVEGAIDEDARVQLFLEAVEQKYTTGKPKVEAMLEGALAKVVKQQCLSKTELINTLTSMNCYAQPDAPNPLAGTEFYHALRVVYTGNWESEFPPKTLERIVWRRCMLRDDWIAINNTLDKEDETQERLARGTALFATLAEGYEHGLYPPVYP